MRALLYILGGVLLLPLVAIGTVLIGMRHNVRPILNAVRRINRDFTNPRALGDAEKPDSTRTVVRHVGRRSGKAYETPVDSIATDRGTLLIALPYGPDTDWVRNITAAGGADLVRQARDLHATAPRVVATAEVVDDLPASLRRTLRLFDVENCLELQFTDR